MITAAAIFLPTSDPAARTPTQVADAIWDAVGADLTPAGWSTFIAPDAAHVAATESVATVTRSVALPNGAFLITLA